jgi:nucleotide-binding universal stress UspA family protein
MKIRRILVCTDGSPLSDKASGMAMDLAKKLTATLTIFHATEDYPNGHRAMPLDELEMGRACMEAEVVRKLLVFLDYMHEVHMVRRCRSTCGVVRND